MAGNDSGPTRYGWHSGDEDVLRCQKEYQLSKVLGVAVAGATKSAYNVGVLFHAGRARWFTLRFKSDDATWDSIVAALNDEAEAQPHPVSDKDKAFALAITRQYVAWWGAQPKPRPMATEKLLGPVNFGDGELHTVRVDDVSYYSGGMAIGEGKTSSGSPSNVIAHYERNGGQLIKQMAVYKAAGEPFGPVGGIVLDVVRKGYGGRPCEFKRDFITITDRQVYAMIEALRIGRANRRRIDAGGHAERSWQCNRVAGGVVVACPFVDLCKYGKAAAMKYTIAGQPMDEWQGTPEQVEALWS